MQSELSREYNRLTSQPPQHIAPIDRKITLGPGLASIPEQLLLDHARGRVLFIAGAGISRTANLPDFRGLVKKVYERIEQNVYNIIRDLPDDACNCFPVNLDDIEAYQAAEVRRFISRDYDVCLGMLERRMDGQGHAMSSVRKAVRAELLKDGVTSTTLHEALIKLSDRGGAVTIMTTNFDLLLQEAASKLRQEIQSHSLGAIPKPSGTESFAGVLHIHGSLSRNSRTTSELVLTDQDFGEYYLRRRIVPDLIYDAARIFSLVLVGYTANDPPMRYLLNAIAADGTRFDDLKRRYVFVGQKNPDAIELEDWKARGITPITYDSENDHSALVATLIKWSQLAPNGNPKLVDAEIKRITKSRRSLANDSDRDLFDHLIRRSNSLEQARLSNLATSQKAEFEWLDAILKIMSEPKQM